MVWVVWSWYIADRMLIVILHEKQPPEYAGITVNGLKQTEWQCSHYSWSVIERSIKWAELPFRKVKPIL